MNTLSVPSETKSSVKRRYEIKRKYILTKRVKNLTERYTCTMFFTRGRLYSSIVRIPLDSEADLSRRDIRAREKIVDSILEEAMESKHLKDLSSQEHAGSVYGRYAGAHASYIAALIHEIRYCDSSQLKKIKRLIKKDIFHGLVPFDKEALRSCLSEVSGDILSYHYGQCKIFADLRSGDYRWKFVPTLRTIAWLYNKTLTKPVHDIIVLLETFPHVSLKLQYLAPSGTRRAWIRITNVKYLTFNGSAIILDKIFNYLKTLFFDEDENVTKDMVSTMRMLYLEETV